ncbi:MAG: hypothetical protein V4617_11210 [Gemmatimonadota bacterium]
MTLLESVVAFVLLAVVGVACLDLSRGATGLETRSVEWTRAVALGDAALDAATAGIPLDAKADASTGNDAGGTARSARVEREPWAKGDGIDVVTVVVTLPGGAEYRASRLVPADRRGAVRSSVNRTSAAGSR